MYNIEFDGHVVKLVLFACHRYIVLNKQMLIRKAMRIRYSNRVIPVRQIMSKTLNSNYTTVFKAIEFGVVSYCIPKIRAFIKVKILACIH